MEAGLGVLRLAPCDFWAMTPRELDAALRGAFGAPGPAMRLGRDQLEALMARFPDRQKE
ncbi:phage tail assembly chaperone [Methyloligella sp. 2.7D]|uniref:phage tail assembly chaperone n=1 Tax=unclassified Methyloligella TaxID=2625955 RepID=UPI00157BC1DD|nr:phage tail assembly chaperone [Methyloligella sp. GL2]QKP77118.1 phage tail assembly chaperone [Methyloligella sp. GL2]